MLANPAHQQLPAVRAPPVTVVAAQLLGRAELGRAQAHLGVRVRQLGDDPAVEPGYPQRAPVQVGDRGPVRAELGVDAGPGDRDLAGDPGGQVAGEQAARQRDAASRPAESTE